MRLPKRGEKGFTLIELLIVVAILGVLAAVVIPNVGRFLGRGEEEARTVEYNTVRLAVTALMVENGLADIPDPSNAYAVLSTATNKMDEFPDTTATLLTKGANAAFELAAGDDSIKTVNTVSTNPLTYYYTCEADGTIRQFNMDDLDHLDIVEYTY